MKIVVFIWDFFGGGAERVAVTLANAFKAAGHDVRIVAGRSEGPNRSLVRADVPVLLPSSPSPRKVLSHLRAVIDEDRPDVVLSHQTTRNVLAILAHLSVRGRRSRLVVGVEHGEMSYTSLQTRGAGLKAYFHLARLLYPLASSIVVVSNNVGLSVRRFLRPIPIRPRTLPNPVVFPGFYDRAGEAPSHPFLVEKQGPVFVAVGRLEEQKNYSLLLRSFQLLRRSVPARLVVFGIGRLQSALEVERAELGLEDSVDFAGYVENPLPAIRAADALVLSSTWEGLPTVAIEALACGTQVVSTNNSRGIHDILEEGELGWITSSDDAQTLADAMAQALSSPKDPLALRHRAMAYEAATVADAYIAHFDGLKSRYVG